MITLSPAEARRRLVSHLGLARPLGHGGAAVRKLLERLRCIQLDPLDMIGTNADLVVMARIDEVKRGEFWNHLFPHHAFEHFAKERCILPESAFPWYRQRGHHAETPWWQHGERERRVPKKLTQAVLAEIRTKGPVTARDLTDHGAVEPLDWSGWKGTGKLTSMALEILWTRCDIVVCGRTGNGSKIYDVPERALGEIASAPAGADFERWALRDRVEAAGLLSRAGGSHWSMLRDVRTSNLPDEMITAGEIAEVMIEGSPRRFLASTALLSSRAPRYDDRVRILGPLDPLLWDRDLVRTAFAFDYVWEVYKPAHLRKWGWYVCPLLHRDRLIGRIDARIEKNVLAVRKLWLESEDMNMDSAMEGIREALNRHAMLSGCRSVRLPRRPAKLPRP